MTIDIKQYEQLKRRVETLQREHDRAEGALGQLMTKLADEHGCETLDDARAKAKQLKVDAEAAESEYDAALAEFEEKWGDRLAEK